MLKRSGIDVPTSDLDHAELLGRMEMARIALRQRFEELNEFARQSWGTGGPTVLVP